jgi:hypothetical protein
MFLLKEHMFWALCISRTANPNILDNFSEVKSIILGYGYKAAMRFLIYPPPSAPFFAKGRTYTCIPKGRGFYFSEPIPSIAFSTIACIPSPFVFLRSLLRYGRNDLSFDLSITERVERFTYLFLSNIKKLSASLIR